MIGILELRGKRVMLDFDLAALYGVALAVLREAVRQNAERFPSDFMFPLTRAESRALAGLPKGPVSAFTEHGMAMLSSVLRTPQAVDVNIQIIRAFAPPPVQ